VSLLARVELEELGDVSIAAVEGEVDASNAAEVAERLRSSVTNHSTVLVVDLTGTTYLDSAGINLLFALSAELEHRQQRLRLVVPPSAQIARMVAIAGLGAVVPTHPTRDEALDARP
jgi:anti-anti-sigma factor